jgi:predicted nucleic acid-binding protein
VKFGEIKAQLERDGTPIDDMDIAIAAVAASHGADIVTAI